MMKALARQLARLASTDGHVIQIEQLTGDIEAAIVSCLSNNVPVVIELTSKEHFSVITGASLTRYRLFDSHQWHYAVKNVARQKLTLKVRLN